MILLLHVVLTEVPQWYSSGARADLEGGRQLQSHLWQLVTDAGRLGSVGNVD